MPASLTLRKAKVDKVLWRSSSWGEKGEFLSAMMKMPSACLAWILSKSLFSYKVQDQHGKHELIFTLLR